MEGVHSVEGLEVSALLEARYLAQLLGPLRLQRQEEVVRLGLHEEE